MIYKRLLLTVLLVLPLLVSTRKVRRGSYLIGITNHTLESISPKSSPGANLDLSNLGIVNFSNGVFKSVANITSLNLSDNQMYELPPSAFSDLVKLESLFLAKNELAETENVFLGLDKLKKLDLSNNILTNIGDNYFAGLPDGVEIITAGNPLTSLKPSVFRSSKPPELSFGEFSDLTCPNNPLEEAVASVGSMFADSWNSFMRIVDERRRRKSNLMVCIKGGVVERLDLRVGELPKGCVNAASRGRKVDLRNLKIRGFESDWYKLKNDLYFEAIDLSDNAIAEISENALNQLPSNIKSVSFDGNSIKSLSRDVIANKYVTRLSFVENLIDHIDDDTFKYTSLRSLRLDRNDLKGIDFVATLPYTLEKLSLSHNRIADISDTDFSTLSRLQKLYLDHNHIREIKNDTFDGLKRLVKLALRANDLKELEVESFRGLHCTTALDLEENSLDRVNGVIFKNLKNLQELNLANNRIGVIPKGFARYLTKATDLKLDNNPFEKLERGAFYGLPRKDLSLPHLLNELFSLDMAEENLSPKSRTEESERIAGDISLAGTNIKIIEGGLFEKY